MLSLTDSIVSPALISCFSANERGLTLHTSAPMPRGLAHNATPSGAPFDSPRSITSRRVRRARVSSTEPNFWLDAVIPRPTLNCPRTNTLLIATMTHPTCSPAPVTSCASAFSNIPVTRAPDLHGEGTQLTGQVPGVIGTTTLEMTRSWSTSAGEMVKRSSCWSCVASSMERSIMNSI